MKYIKLKKGMSRNEVNELISKWITLENEVYLGNNETHNWRCKCGNIFTRSFSNIVVRNKFKCRACFDKDVENDIKFEVELSGEYEYINTLRRKELDCLKVKNTDGRFISVKHIYCGGMRDIRISSFRKYNRCPHCCQTYEKSFAHHIEVELGLKLEDIWDFERNTVNPYHISRGSGKKVWVKCQEKDYHGSYEVACNNFIKKHRCPYCSGHKVHPKDSFAQYHIDNTDPNFLEKYWDYEKNTVNPWSISKGSDKKVWIKCQNEEVNELNGLMKKDYHPSYEIVTNSFYIGNRCSYCACRPQKLHPYDSFGYHNLDKAMSWHPDNDISPFRIARNSHKKYKFICDECGIVFSVDPNHITTKDAWCPECSMSKGEKKIAEWLRYNGIEYEYEKEYDGLVGLGGGLLSYDFYLPEHNMLIEFQGDQHRQYVPGWHINEKGFEKQLLHDKTKREYAENNNILMFEIFEENKKDIDKILKKYIGDYEYEI